MTEEHEIVNAIGALVAGRVYSDQAPNPVARPYIVYQQVGGDAINFQDGGAPSKRNSRFQVVVWAATRAESVMLSAAAEDALRAVAALQTTVLGAAVWSSDDETKLRGTRQDFSFWY